jgi:hypothetical protein
MNQAKEILRRLTGLAQQFGQTKLADEYMKRLPGVMSPEELGPVPEPQVP